jgi:hypothetical protein
VNFQDLGPRELWMLARFAAIPIGVFVALVAWILWLHAGQRTLRKRLAALEAGRRGR